MKTLQSCHRLKGAEACAVLVRGHSVDLGDTPPEDRLPSVAPGGLESARTRQRGLAEGLAPARVPSTCFLDRNHEPHSNAASEVLPPHFTAEKTDPLHSHHTHTQCCLSLFTASHMLSRFLHCAEEGPGLLGVTRGCGRPRGLGKPAWGGGSRGQGRQPEGVQTRAETFPEPNAFLWPGQPGTGKWARLLSHTQSVPRAQLWRWAPGAALSDPASPGIKLSWIPRLLCSGLGARQEAEGLESAQVPAVPSRWPWASGAP